MTVLGHRLHLRRRLDKYWAAEVHEDLLLEAELLTLAFATGIGDVTTFSEYRVFTANHTGNTILLGVASTEIWAHFVNNLKYPIPLPLIGISLAMFIIGGFITGQLGNRVGRRHRWWLVLNSLVQTILVMLSSSLQVFHTGWASPPKSGPVDIGSVSMVVVAMLAFSAGGQVAAARSLCMTEITTANATSTYVDLLIDTKLFTGSNRGRNRRLCSLACLCTGSFCGGFAYEKYGSGVTLFLSGLFKLIVTILLLFNRDGECLLPKTEPESSWDQTPSDRTGRGYYTDSAEPRSTDILSDKTLVANKMLSEKLTRYAGFDAYRGNPYSPPVPISPVISTRRITSGTFLDLSDGHSGHAYVHIPGWDINTSANLPSLDQTAHLPRVSKARTKPYWKGRDY